MCREIASVFAFLHDKSEVISHRDLKPENVVFDSHGSAKACVSSVSHVSLAQVVDFGMAGLIARSRHTAVACSPLYMAPEVPFVLQRLDFTTLLRCWAIVAMITV